MGIDVKTDEKTQKTEKESISEPTSVRNKQNNHSLWGEVTTAIHNNREQVCIACGASLVGVIVSILIAVIFGDDWLGRISNVLQVVTVILAVLAWINTVRILEKRRNLKTDPSHDDAIIIVGLADKTKIEKSVETYCDNHNMSALEEFQDGRGFVYSNPQNQYMELQSSIKVSGALFLQKIKDMPESDESSIQNYVIELRTCIKQAYEICANRKKIHLFVSAPTELSAIIMPYFVNKKEVVVYHYVKSAQDQYIQIGPVEER